MVVVSPVVLVCGKVSVCSMVCASGIIYSGCVEVWSIVAKYLARMASDWCNTYGMRPRVNMFFLSGGGCWWRGVIRIRM